MSHIMPVVMAITLWKILFIKGKYHLTENSFASITFLHLHLRLHLYPRRRSRIYHQLLNPSNLNSTSREVKRAGLPHGPVEAACTSFLAQKQALPWMTISCVSEHRSLPPSRLDSRPAVRHPSSCRRSARQSGQPALPARRPQRVSPPRHTRGRRFLCPTHGQTTVRWCTS